MKAIFAVAVPIIGALLLIKPATNYLNRQSSINPSSNLLTYSTDTSGTFHRNLVNIPAPEQESDVLGSKSGSSKNKRIDVDLTSQKLYAYEGNKKVYSFLVSTGKWGPTPTGEFKIWTKLTSTLMTGGSKALGTYYYLPNVPYTMYFYNNNVPKYKGYGIHGAYWHNNFGHPMSHGCINMKSEEAKVLFNWASSESKDSSGTKIVIYGTAPRS